MCIPDGMRFEKRELWHHRPFAGGGVARKLSLRCRHNRNLLIDRPEVLSPFPWYMRAYAATDHPIVGDDKNSD